MTKLQYFMALLLLACLPGAGCSDSGTANEAVLRLSISAEPPTLDWSLARDGVSFEILNNLMEGLTQFDDELRAVPAVARDWSISADGRIYTFHLREDVLWSDGRPVTADDFEFSWKRLLDPATAAEYAYFLFDIENAQEYNSGRLTDAGQVGVRAVSPRTLEVRLKRPVVYFPSLTTFMVTFPQRKDMLERHGRRWTDPENLVTNGPFTLAEWRHEYKLELKANRRYYAGRPKLDRVGVFIVGERSTALTLYETGDLDMVILPPVAIEHYRRHPEFSTLPLLRGYYYGFNSQKPPFDNVRVRRAFSLAVDRSRLPEILKGGEAPTASWIPRGMFGHNPDIGPRFDPARARRLLEEAGYPGGRGLPPVTAVFNSDSTHRLVGEFLQAQWKENLGVEVTLDSQEWKVYLSRVRLDPPQLFRMGWGADFPDPDNFMNLFTSTSGNNPLQWSNRRYDELVARGAAEADPGRRQIIYDEAQKLLTEEEAPMISLFVSSQNLLTRPHVRGLKPNALELLYLKRARLEKAP